MVNSTIPVAERQQAFENLERKKLELLFLAPEQFNNEDVLAKVKAAKASLFVVDEAHCVTRVGS